MIFRVLAVTATALVLACPASAFARNSDHKRPVPYVHINGVHPLNPQPLPPLKVPLTRTAV